MKKKLFAMMLLAGGSMFAQTRFTFSVGFGGPNRGYYNAAPAPYFAVRPPCPGPDYFWTGEYWTRQPDRRYQTQRQEYRDRDFRRDHDDDRDRGYDQRRPDNYNSGNGYRGR